MWTVRIIKEDETIGRDGKSERAYDFIVEYTDTKAAALVKAQQSSCTSHADRIIVEEWEIVHADMFYGQHGKFKEQHKDITQVPHFMKED